MIDLRIPNPRPCPFCGSEDCVVVESRPRVGWVAKIVSDGVEYTWNEPVKAESTWIFHVECCDCQARGPGVPIHRRSEHPSCDEAITSWNRRTKHERR